MHFLSLHSDESVLVACIYAFSIYLSLLKGMWVNASLFFCNFLGLFGLCSDTWM